MQPSMQNAEKLRILEALLFAAAEPLDEKTLAAPFDEEEDIAPLLQQLEENYASRGVHLTCVGGRWAFRTAEDLGYLLEKHTVTQRRLSRAALETLSIIAYHQPTTRAEIEEIRGVATSKGTLDVLLETGWIKMRGRRRAPGRPVTYGTSHAFLEHFGFESLADLPGLSELKGAGLLSSSVPAGFVMPIPTDLPELTEDEDRLDDPHPDDLDDGPGLFDDDPDERGDDNDLDLDTPDAER
ncbi:MAG: SMC-Scp complex subunit ScpB [Pseudomonadota bacterium]